MTNLVANYELYYVAETNRYIKGSPSMVRRKTKKTGEKILGSSKGFVKIGYPTVAIIYEVVNCERTRAIDPTDYLKEKLKKSTITKEDYVELVDNLNKKTMSFNALHSVYKVEL